MDGRTKGIASRGRWLAAAGCAAALVPAAAAAQQVDMRPTHTQTRAQTLAPRRCRQAVLEGQVEAGQSFSAPLGDGLVFLMQPIASGWILRVEPRDAPPVDPDYAELATPPYRSVTPLSVSTDFSFRAQDAVGWNPRRFRIVPDRTAYRLLLDAFRQLPARGNDPPAAAAQVLAHGAAGAIPAEFRILDARLVPGTANQWQAAAAVASHFNTTAHTILTGPDAGTAPLGVLRWMRFQLQVDLPAGFRAAPGLKVRDAPCVAPG